MLTGLVLPVALAVGSTLCYATAAAVQRGENALAPRDATWRDALRSLLRRRRWWVGVGVMALGAVLHVTALGLGSITLVQPIGVLSLVLALPIDARLNRRRVVRAEWTSAAVL